jgi:pimeloyl-ACP methyl ester carboxylesterase
LGKRLAAHPKVHVIDSGLAGWLLGLSATKINSRNPAALTEFGHLVETFAVGEILKQVSWSDEVITASHFRTESGDEADLVLETWDGRVAAFEIKAGTRIKDPDLNGLRLLRDRLGDRFLGGFILNLGELAYRKEERITILPLSALWSLPNSPALPDLNLAQLAEEMLNASGPADGDLVLLVHGFPQTCRARSAQVQALGQAGWHAVAPDMRGFAVDARPEPVAEYAQDLVAGDVLAIAAQLGADSFHLVGHDLGGIIAWDVACRHPARVRTVAAASTPHLPRFAAALQARQEPRLPPFDLFRQPGVAARALLDGDAFALRAGYAGLDQPVIEEYVRHFSQPGALTAALNHFRAFNFGDWLTLPAATRARPLRLGADDPYLARSTALATARTSRPGTPRPSWTASPTGYPELAPEAVTALLHPAPECLTTGKARCHGPGRLLPPEPGDPVKASGRVPQAEVGCPRAVRRPDCHPASWRSDETWTGSQ